MCLQVQPRIKTQWRVSRIYLPLPCCRRKLLIILPATCYIINSKQQSDSNLISNNILPLSPTEINSWLCQRGKKCNTYQSTHFCGAYLCEPDKQIIPPNLHRIYKNILFFSFPTVHRWPSSFLSDCIIWMHIKSKRKWAEEVHLTFPAYLSSFRSQKWKDKWVNLCNKETEKTFTQ